jgi:hypothetical protein
VTPTASYFKMVVFMPGYLYIMGPFGYADKPDEKHCWLICCERKTLFRLKKQAEKYGL